MRIIPNGIDYDRFSALPRIAQGRRPTVALIGRVVPIKDVKTYIQACALLCRDNPEVEALIMGPEDEDPAYAAECRQLAADLGLNGNLRFTGRVRLDDYLPRIDAIVLSSISEAQPLTVLEAGAAGIPSVVTDVGACRAHPGPRRRGTQAGSRGCRDARGLARGDRGGPGQDGA